MRPIDEFSKRLDVLFEMGNPTKAQLYDAYHKTNPNSITDYCECIDPDFMVIVNEGLTHRYCDECSQIMNPN